MDTTSRLGLPPPFDEAMRRHEREILRFISRVTGNRDDALDLFQETCLRAYRAWPTLDSEDGVRPWLFRIATNLCRNRARDMARRSRVFVTTGNDLSDAARAHSSSNHSRDGVIDISGAIRALPEKQRLAFAMRKLTGMDYSEIGEALGCSEDSARASVYQALKKLRALE
ncbi:MAG TPA: sigma-70 family RNA polymerase sigma factor [Candidatus Binataceae bacterium]|nr:sigma-70 family RNA polymerase sigma factor [Candidatus Binataceae bacterium]